VTTRAFASNDRGFGLTELLVVVGMLGVLSAVAVPNLISYYQTAVLGAGTEQLAATLTRARHLAVRQNTSVCVERSGTTLRLRTVNCSGTIWTGAGTDSTGTVTISNGLQVGGATTMLFTSAGGATFASGTQATFSLTDPKSNRLRNVVVTSTGRVSIQ
jgi:prepilin-type N-terminal cleavage/methylation domain-containing protein